MFSLPTNSCPCCRCCSRMHAIESHRMSHEQQQMDAYAAAVQEQQRQEQPQPQPEAEAEAAGGSTDSANNDSTSASSNGWQQILGLDPIARKLRRSKLAKLAYRR